MGSAGGSSSSKMHAPPQVNFNFRHLPVRMRKDFIVSKIMVNRVTLVVADTGSGKSSQVPQMLLEEGYEPIICTQPRRLAVVSISRMVAESLGCEIGEDVGYHIGQLKVASDKTRIIFKTAGVLLEELKGEGLAALSCYKVVILDEVHERSVESDLVLTCVKQLILKNSNIRLVLMSATADINRYKDYFKDLGKTERVEVIAVPSTLSPQVPFRCRERYLDDVFKLLGNGTQNSCGAERTETFHVPKMGDEVYGLILELVRHIHETDSTLSNSILVFLPTYLSLEKQWLLLKRSAMQLKVHILHSSIDTEEAIKSMEINYHCRKVILATNIAESSVTIPGVAYVIDSCRSLEIYYDHNNKTDTSQIVWVSKSQANQRKGRTGRTCDGQVFRLISNHFYNSFDTYEMPAMHRLSLRKQVLMISCAKSKLMNDPKVIFQKVLDPPDMDTVQNALEMLISIDAIHPVGRRGKYEPTLYGHLLGNIPLSLEASVLVVKLGLKGYLREGAFIGSLMNTHPLPIIQPFGQKELFNSHLELYHKNGDQEIYLQKNDILIANLFAVQFWQRIFKDKHRLQRLHEVAGGEYDHALITSKLEQEWASFHHLVQSSLNSVAETYEVVMGKVHQFRPKFLHMLKGPPLYYNDYHYRHICVLSHEETEAGLGSTVNPAIDTDASNESFRAYCIQLPYLKTNSFNSQELANVLSMVIKEVRSHCTQQSDTGTQDCFNVLKSLAGVPPCKFFARGMCNRGNNCSFSHSNKELCKNFMTLEGCRYGDSCWYSHDLVGSTISESSQPVEFEDDNCSIESFLMLLPNGAEFGSDSVLIFGETQFIFATKLCSIYDPKKITASTFKSETEVRHIDAETDKNINSLSRIGVNILWNLDPSCLTTSTDINWSNVRCILWTIPPQTFSESADLRDVLTQFFEFMAVKFITEAIPNVNIILTMHNMKYAHLQVERVARDCFFFLKASIPFDDSFFGIYPAMKEKIPPTKPVSYVFELQQPTDIIFGNYTHTLQKRIKSNT